MNKQQYLTLQKYEEQLSTAKIGNYVRKMYKSTLEELDSVYKQLFPNEDSRLFSGCGKCILRATRRLADEYFKYKEKLENKQKEKDKENGKE